MKFTKFGQIQTDDGHLVPVDDENADYAALKASGALDTVAPYVEPPKSVPASVYMWQAKAALEGLGMLDGANAVVAASGSKPLQIAWEYATEVSRASPAVAAIAGALKLSSVDVDALFVAASELKV